MCVPPVLRGLHSFNFQLNESAFCGIGDAFRGFSRGVEEVFRGIAGALGGVLGAFCLRYGSG
jgi:hypothetical protein